MDSLRDCQFTTFTAWLRQDSEQLLGDMLPTPDSSQNEDVVMASSPSTPVPEVSEVEPADSSCTHLLDLWKNPAQKASLLKKFKSVILWCASGYRVANHGTKKRKVSCVIRYISSYIGSLSFSLELLLAQSAMPLLCVHMSASTAHSPVAGELGTCLVI